MWTDYAPQRFDAQGVTASATSGTTIPNGAAAHVKSATWTTVGTPTFDAMGFWLHFNANPNSGSFLVDVGFGASPVAPFAVENLLLEKFPGASMGCDLYIPVPVPVGVPVRLRYQATSGSAGTTISASITFVGATHDAPPLSSLVRCHGADVATSLGTNVPGPTATAHTYGTTTTLQLIRSGEGIAAQNTTVEPYKAIFVAFGTLGSSVRQGARHQFNLHITPPGEAIGIVLADFFSVTDTAAGDLLSWQLSPIIPLYVPTGSVISMSHKSSALAVGGTIDMDACVYGIV